MCGIAGIVSTEPLVERDTLIRMRETMAHRGPDAAGLWLAPDRRAGLAHRRLAIIDRTPAGHQPMADPSEMVHIVLNGEIYNFRELRRELEQLGHQFRSASDTEVVLNGYREWGIDLVSRLEGMYALGIYDQTTRRLFLVRDRAGEKPLFVWQYENGLAFASELKALLSLPDFPRELDPDAVDCYLAYGYIPRHLCVARVASKLAPGHILSYDLDSGRSVVSRYWDLPISENPSNADTDAETLTDELEELLSRSIARQLSADVPVAIMLSGGIDSSVITALAARSAPKVKTFTVSFPGSGSWDETRFASMVASYLGTDHISVTTEGVTEDILPLLARHYDEPLGDSSMIPMFVISRLIREQVTVAIGGDGGDELFGGYLHYAWLRRFDPLRQKIPAAVRRAIALVAGQTPVGIRGRNYALGLADEARGLLGRVNTFFDPASRARLLSRGKKSLFPERFRAGLGDDGASLLNAAQRMDFRSYLPDDILTKVDRSSMLASLEVRAPFLDVGLVEFAFGRVPDDLKSDGRNRKVLLRRLAARLLPSNLDLARKQGFSVPLHRWFAGSWGEFIEAVLEDEGSLFDRRMVRDLFAAQRRGRRNEHRLFALAMFELWRRDYGFRFS